MLLPVKLEEGMSVAMLFVLQILVEQSESFRGTCRQGRGQVIQVEPAHIEAFLITDKWLDIASRLQSAQERMIMYMVLSPLAYVITLLDEVTATRSVTMASTRSLL